MDTRTNGIRALERLGVARRLVVRLAMSVLVAVPAASVAWATTTGGARQMGAASQAPYSEFRGVKLGMSAADVRAKLGKPSTSDDTQDFFVFSDRERARVYYADGKATAIVASYIGDKSNAPDPVTIVGEVVEPDSSGALSKMVRYPERGYTVMYSRTGGDTPMVFVTLQKSP